MSKQFEQISIKPGFMKHNGGLLFREISKNEYESISNVEIFLQLLGIFKSNSEIKRSLKENSIMINKERVNDHFDFDSISLIKKKYILLQRISYVCKRILCIRV